MSPPRNSALYMDDGCTLSVKRDFPVPRPEPDEALVEVLFSGINPADTKHGTYLGVHPVVMGYDFSGHIVSAPPDSGFSPGDAVAGCTPTGVGRPTRFGTHQDYLACPVDLLFHVPNNLPMDHAACLPVVAKTAADALFSIFQLPLPGGPLDQGGSDDGGSILIWGGSTAVGCCAIQYARACGVKDILVTASASRHEMLRSLGATRCFDYRNPKVEAEIAAAMDAGEHRPIRYALDTVGTLKEGPELTTAEKMRTCVGGDAMLVSVTYQGPDFIMPLASRDRDATFHITGMPGPVTLPRDVERSTKIEKALTWAVMNYDNGFALPAVKVFDGTGEGALKELETSAAGGTFGKVAIKHPLSN